MQITSANCGDMLCLYHSGQRIRILEVDERAVTYLRESGDRYITTQYYFDAFVDTNPDRMARFDENSRLGEAYIAAEKSALKTMLSDPNATDEERQEAQQVLNTVSEQREFMNRRMAGERAAETPGKMLASAFLSALYERGTGSHDTFWGHRVENVSQTTGTVSIDGRHYDYSDAEAHLSQVLFKAPAKGLDAQILSADRRRKAAAASRDATPFADRTER